MLSAASLVRRRVLCVGELMVAEIDDGFLAGWNRLTCTSGWWCKSVKFLDLLVCLKIFSHLAAFDLSTFFS